MMYTPIDHLPASLRDGNCLRRDAEIDRRKTMYRQARGMATALRAVTDRQRGGLTRSDGHILSLMILQNLRSCVRRERHYRPTRARLAAQSGYSERTVSQSIGRLKAHGVIVVARYAKGGRLGDKGRGLATEFRSGCLQFLVDQLAGLGYRLPKTLRADLADLAKWAAVQVGEQPEQSADSPCRQKPTGKQLPGTLYPMDRGTPKHQGQAPVDASEGLNQEEGLNEDDPTCQTAGQDYRRPCHEGLEHGQDARSFAFHGEITDHDAPPKRMGGAAKKVEAGDTQQAVADALGWSRSAVRDFASLQKIAADAWQVVGATIRDVAPSDGDGVAPQFGATAPFTEGLLRSILPLRPEQQTELVRRLARGKCSKGRPFGKRTIALFTGKTPRHSPMPRPPLKPGSLAYRAAGGDRYLVPMAPSRGGAALVVGAVPFSLREKFRGAT